MHCSEGTKIDTSNKRARMHGTVRKTSGQRAEMVIILFLQQWQSFKLFLELRDVVSSTLMVSLQSHLLIINQ